MSHWVLEIEYGRALTSISLNTIHFNLTGHMEFDTHETLCLFLNKWRGHFFDISTLLPRLVENRKVL